MVGWILGTEKCSRLCRGNRRSYDCRTSVAPERAVPTVCLLRPRSNTWVAMSIRNRRWRRNLPVDRVFVRLVLRQRPRFLGHPPSGLAISKIVVSNDHEIQFGDVSGVGEIIVQAAFAIGVARVTVHVAPVNLVTSCSCAARLLHQDHRSNCNERR